MRRLLSTNEIRGMIAEDGLSTILLYLDCAEIQDYELVVMWGQLQALVSKIKEYIYSHE